MKVTIKHPLVLLSLHISHWLHWKAQIWGWGMFGFPSGLPAPDIPISGHAGRAQGNEPTTAFPLLARSFLVTFSWETIWCPKGNIHCQNVTSSKPSHSVCTVYKHQKCLGPAQTHSSLNKGKKVPDSSAKPKELHLIPAVYGRELKHKVRDGTYKTKMKGLKDEPVL